MSCVRPFYVKDTRNPVNGQLVEFPCGVCQQCLMARSRLIELRAKYEHKSHKYAAFITFTYNDDNLPFSLNTLVPTLRRLDFHRYIDTVRHRARSVSSEFFEPSFSFLACGEYGDQFQRPHYHVLFFGVDFAHCRDFLKRSWPYGSIMVQPVMPGSVRYVVKYLNKTSKLYDSAYINNDVERPFVTWSKGFGRKFFADHACDIAVYGAVRDGQRFLPVPSYYRNLYYRMSIDNIRDGVRRATARHSVDLSAARHFGFDKVYKWRKYESAVSELGFMSRSVQTRSPIDLICLGGVERVLDSARC